MYKYMRSFINNKPSSIVLDIAETEPFLFADHELCVHEPEKVIKGIVILAEAVRAPQMYCLITRKNTRVMQAIRNIAEQYNLHIVKVSHRYPVNTAFQIQQAIKNTAPCMVVRPETAYASYEAVVLDKPQVDKIVAVGGSAITQPGYMRGKDRYAYC